MNNPCETCKGLNRCDSTIQSVCPAYRHYTERSAEQAREEKRERETKAQEARCEHMGWMERHCRWGADNG